ncbi:mucin-2-like isoform X2 [Bacillus rossius redtenbacheri]|uniref:mucin-2-like isoform X2 n=1 Tax=Bacillus rossius redtenbacheri TaxID=93214 RepID=UPI002FDCCD92
MDTYANNTLICNIETDLLMTLAEPFKTILDSTETDANIIQQKNDAWTEISKQYNIKRRFKKKTCRELRKTYLRMVIKSRNKSSEMQTEEDKKPKLKKIKLSCESDEISHQDTSNTLLKKENLLVSASGEKQIDNFLHCSNSTSKKVKKGRTVLSKNCMVIMRPISKAQLKALSDSPIKMVTSVSQSSPPRSKESSVLSSVASYLKVSPKRETLAGENVGVKIPVTSTATQASICDMVSQGKSSIGGASLPRRTSSPSYRNTPSPIRKTHVHPDLTSPGSNFSSTPGCATLTTSMAQTSTSSGISVSSSPNILQLQSPEENIKKTVVNTYSKIHPQVLREAASLSPSKTQFMKNVMWPASAAQPARYARYSNSRASITEPTSLVSTSPKVSSEHFLSSCKEVGSKPANDALTSSPPKDASCKPGNVAPLFNTPKITSCKPANVVPTSASPLKVVTCVPTKVVVKTTGPKVVSCNSANVVPTSTQPKVASSSPANVVPTAPQNKAVSCKSTYIVPTSSPLKVASGKPESENVTVSTSKAGGADPAGGKKLTRYHLVPASQAMALLSRTASRSRPMESVAALPQTPSPVEDPLTSVTTAVGTSAASPLRVTSPVVSSVYSFEESQDEGAATAEPDILHIRVLEANLDVRAARARVEAEEALREEALAKLAMARAEMDHQVLRHRVELRHLRRVNALALRHAKELHAAALALRRKE